MPRVGSKQSSVWTPRRPSARSSPSAGCRPRGAAPRPGRACRSGASRSRRRPSASPRRVRIGPHVAQARRERERDVLAHGALHQQRLDAVGGDVHDAGPDRVRRVAGARPACRPPRARRRPGAGARESTSNSSSWPWPSSATSPSTSPGWSSNETSWSLVPARRLGAVRRGTDGRARRPGRPVVAIRGGRHAARADLRRASASRSAARRRVPCPRRPRSRRRAARWRGRRGR